MRRDISAFQTIKNEATDSQAVLLNTPEQIVQKALYCILTSIHTASAVLSGPSGGQCLPMAHQL